MVLGMGERLRAQLEPEGVVELRGISGLVAGWYALSKSNLICAMKPPAGGVLAGCG
jgi:hypothetical protein